MKKVIETRTRKKVLINEDKYIQHLLETYPTGILSMVSDGFNLWDICTKYLVKYKQDILSRDGKLVIRPDSGNPVDILCGENIESFDNLEDAKDDFNDDLYENQVHGERHYEIPETRLVRVGDKFYQLNADTDWNRYDKQYYFIESIDIQATPIDVEPKHKGVIELLWDVFGGTINEQGYKVLDPHIGAIYGDSITINRADEICERLEKKGFASTNVTLGLGSFNYQYNTRDTFGFAMKATYVELEVPMHGELSDQNLNTKIIGREIFKNPVTDDGTKKSATGLLCVTYDNENGYMLADKVTWDGEANGVLKTIYKEGSMFNQTTLTEIRNKLKINLVL
jgi:nicotinamide phosphoribosyltransferase